jgi:hypothetical protein
MQSALTPTRNLDQIKAIGARRMISPLRVLLNRAENTYATVSFLGKASGQVALAFAVTATSIDIR